ncbi:hypothetical protein L195_g048779, partial [Trifolium pratense]
VPHVNCTQKLAKYEVVRRQLLTQSFTGYGAKSAQTFGGVAASDGFYTPDFKGDFSLSINLYKEEF